MKKLIIITLTLMLASCGSTYNLSTDYRIKSILTIAESGDTIAVPIRDFKFRVLDGRVREIIDREQFRFRQNWYPNNYNRYHIPYVNRRYNYSNSTSNSKPFVVKPIKSTKVIKPYKPINTIPKLKPVKQ